MSIQTQIDRISGNVSAALAAIAEKGVTVPDGSNSDALHELILSIEAGGGGGGCLIGTFTLTEATNNVTIEHNLGKIPSFAMYIIKNATSKNNNRMYGCGGIPNVSYFRFGKTTSEQITVKASSVALTKKLGATNPCWIGSLNEHSMDVGSEDGNVYYFLETGVEYLWLVLP